MRWPEFPSSRLCRSVLAACACLAGCAAGPDFRLPTADVPTALVRTSSGIDVQAPLPVEAQWWRAYGSPRIDALVERAWARNATLDASKAALEQAQQLVLAQRGLFWPQVSAGYSGSRQNTGTLQSSPLASGQSLYNLHTAQLTVGYVPDVFGGNRRAVESLQASADAQRFQLAAARITVAANVVGAAIQEQLLLEQRQAARDAAQVAAQQLAQSRLLRAAGYVSELDLAQQEAASAQAEALLPPLDKQLEQTRNLLAVLCGDMPATELPPGAGALQMPGPLPGVLPGRLLEQRPDVAAAQALLHAAAAQVGVARAAELPSFSITGGVSWSATVLRDVFSAPARSWDLVAGVTAPIFSGGSLRARTAAAQAAADQAQAQWRQVVLAAYQNVADTLAALDADRRALDKATLADAANEKLARLTGEQLRLGYVALPQALAARQSFLQGRLALLAARATYFGDTVALYQALGGGWTTAGDSAAVAGK